MEKIVILAGKEHDLCFLPLNKLTPFVVWRRDFAGGGHNTGTYAATLADALASFARRSLECPHCGWSVTNPDDGVEIEGLKEITERTEDYTCPGCGKCVQRRYVLLEVNEVKL